MLKYRKDCCYSRAHVRLRQKRRLGGLRLLTPTKGMMYACLYVSRNRQNRPLTMRMPSRGQVLAASTSAWSRKLRILETGAKFSSSCLPGTAPTEPKGLLNSGLTWRFLWGFRSNKLREDGSNSTACAAVALCVCVCVRVRVRSTLHLMMALPTWNSCKLGGCGVCCLSFRHRLQAQHSIVF